MPQDRRAARFLGSIVVGILIISFGGGASRAGAQTYAVPADMPTLYEDDPYNATMRRQARYRVKLPNCIVGDQGVRLGYYLKCGHRQFTILNQDLRWLANLAYNGKPVRVEGRVTDNVTGFYDYYYIVIDKIDGQRYAGEVGPCLERQPTKAEIQYWQNHQQLPPATQKMMNYLSGSRP